MTFADDITAYVNGDSSRPLAFGNGEDGDFADGPAGAGITASGREITIDTDTKSKFNFSSFYLSRGASVQVTGARALHIRVNGDAIIEGDIILNGGNGGKSATSKVGGSAVGGGYAGGSGGGANGGAQPSNGSPSSGPILGGSAGLNQAGAGNQKAGGGGCNGVGATDGAQNVPSAGACTLSRASIANNFETTFVGGGGGAGGTAYSAGAAADGAGGGGGGGAIHILSLGVLDVSGSISAKGGTGGDSTFDTNDSGAAGGGGAGGSIWLQTANAFSGNGELDISRGNGGVDDTIIDTYDGGNGSRGVIRIDSKSNTYTGAYYPAGTADLMYDVKNIRLVKEFKLEGGWMCGTLSTRKSDGNTSNLLKGFFGDLFVLALAFAFIRFSNYPTSECRLTKKPY